ncbi:porin family protein [Sediminitomix flava]|uniref:Outer membrane protein with beta-barrel domain n=1 Tax=Sediminitomix flava TaxID=379075 RepID=A0A315YWM6_SEDFL|nr:porin family protein [Sediminitomix flava]PWJ33655.1 outer membrane protein with beta-barrel domain [Sediminitomix flava]
MRALFIFITISILSLSTSFAQSQVSDFDFGFKGGLNLSRESNSVGNSKLGVNLGAYAAYPLTNNLFVQAEMMYASQGERYKTEGIVFKDKLNYLHFPVMAKYYVADGLNLQFGPQLGFMLVGKQKVGDTVTKANDKFNTVDFAFNFGAGYELDNGLGFEVRYSLGVTGIKSSDIDPNQKNRVTQFMLTYKLSELF